jgi:hypothetical protein
MAYPICILHSWEAVELEKHGITPTCSNHKHIKKLEAMELTARGDVVREEAIYRWVTPKAICMAIQGNWIPLMSGYAGPLVLQFQG